MTAPDPSPPAPAQPVESECLANDVRSPSAGSLRGVDLLNFFLADVQTGVGPFLAIYLAAFQWDVQQVGLALTVGGIAGIVTQTPAGGLVDRMRSKRALIAAAIAALVVGSLVIAFFPTRWPVLAAQVLIGGTSSVFIPAVAAISLGLVGHRLFDARQGRNQTFNAAGNVTAAVAMGLIAYFVSDRGIFFFVVAMAIPTILALRLIRPGEIDYDLARGCKPGEPATADGPAGGKPESVFELLKDRKLLVLLTCCVMFHFANAAMLPLLGEMLAKGQGRSSMLFMSACVVTTQLVVTMIAAYSGRLAGSWGRKPVLLIGFAALPIRGVLYTLTQSTPLLVGIQVLDGVAAGIFNVVSVLVIADLTRGTGRFNLAQGAIATAVGIGAALSQVIAGSIVHSAGFNAGFLFLAAVAAAGLGLLWFFMPETGTKNVDAEGRGFAVVPSAAAAG